MILLFGASCLLMSFDLCAQYLQTKYVVRIDPYSRRSPDTAPFDQPFMIFIPIDSSLKEGDLFQLDIYQTFRNGKNEQIFRYDSGQLRNYSRIVDSPRTQAFKFVHVFMNMQLTPGARFGINLYHCVTDDIFEKLDEINFKIMDRDNTAANDYHDLGKLQSVHFSYGEPIKWPSFYDGDNDSIYSPIALKNHYAYTGFFDNGLRKDYEQILGHDTLISNRLDSLKKQFLSNRFFTDSLYRCNCQKDLVATELFADSSKFLIPLLNMTYLDSSLELFGEGYLDIEEFSTHKIIKSNQTLARIRNLERLKDALININYFFHLSTFAASIPHERKKDIYNFILPTIIAIERKIKRMKDAYVDIKMKIKSNHYFFAGERSYSASSPVGQDIKTAAGNYIIPDFGLTNFGTTVFNQFGYGIRPYLGVNISLRPIDKSIPIERVIHKGLIRYSVVLGLTTYQMTREGTNDLFKNMSLIAAIGYRLSRGCRVNGGVILYRHDNPNPVLQQSYTLGPEVSLSMDLDIVSWISKLTNTVIPN
ncbi:MAG TPA: hypothetical protein VK772_12870 [Puia sp.]|nr:hypothetical protein [Puia sp.]